MFKQKILEEIFSNEEMQKIPCGCQSTAIHVVQDVIEKIEQENPYATLSELFESTV